MTTAPNIIIFLDIKEIIAPKKKKKKKDSPSWNITYPSKFWFMKNYILSIEFEPLYGAMDFIMYSRSVQP